MKINRRKAITGLSLLPTTYLLPKSNYAKQTIQSKGIFRYCLNTSTISGQKLGLKSYIDIASAAGYDGIEVWVSDVKAYLESGNKASELKKYIVDKNLKVENAIGFSPWISGGEAGMKQMQEEMEMLASIGGTRIAAAPAGENGETPLDFLKVGV